MEDREKSAENRQTVRNVFVTRFVSVAQRAESLVAVVGDRRRDLRKENAFKWKISGRN